MAKPPYYWVLRGLYGETARTRYLEYLNGLVQTGKEEGTPSEPRPPRIPIYIEPWSIPLAANTVSEDSAEQIAWNLMSSISPVNTRASNALGGDTGVFIKSYKAPRVSRIQVDQTGTRTRSRTTNRLYTKYDHQSNSVPFGRKTGDTTITGAFAEIAAAIDSPPTVRTQLIDEKY